MNSNNPLLKLHLEAFVPVMIEEFLAGQRVLTMPRPDLATYLATNGDAIIYRSPGRTAKAVNALVEALATMAFCPGGVRFMGLHFEVSSDRIQACLPDFVPAKPKQKPNMPDVSQQLATFEQLFRHEEKT